MESFFALLAGLLVAAAVYLMLSGQMMRFLFGLIILSNAANLIIFVSGRLTPGAPPLIPDLADAPVGPVANALPQALVLTAIVIGFGLFAFALVLVLRAWQVLGTLEGDEMRLAEPLTAKPTPPEAAPKTHPADQILAGKVRA